MDFRTPLHGQFHYFGWNTRPRRIGPRPLLTRERVMLEHQLEDVAQGLGRLPGVGVARLLRATVVPPLQGAPSSDTILLVDATTPIHEDLHRLLHEHGAPRPSTTWTAHNAARFGDTDHSTGPVLLNHFAGETDPDAAADTWRRISRWYESALHVDNSTLLQFDPGSPYLVMNYAIIPTRVARFLLSQASRPGFYRHVSSTLSRSRMRPYPLFATRIALRDEAASLPTKSARRSAGANSVHHLAEVEASRTAT